MNAGLSSSGDFDLSKIIPMEDKLIFSDDESVKPIMFLAFRDDLIREKSKAVFYEQGLFYEKFKEKHNGQIMTPEKVVGGLLSKDKKNLKLKVIEKDFQDVGSKSIDLMYKDNKGKENVIGLDSKHISIAILSTEEHVRLFSAVNRAFQDLNHPVDEGCGASVLHGERKIEHTPLARPLNNFVPRHKNQEKNNQAPTLKKTNAIIHENLALGEQEIDRHLEVVAKKTQEKDNKNTAEDLEKELLNKENVKKKINNKS